MKYLIMMLVIGSLLSISFLPTPSTNTFSQVAFDSPKYQCNRYGDPQSNFEILSICPTGTEDPQGQYLASNIDNIKNWIVTRWSLPNGNFAIKCKIVVAPDRATFTDIFGKDTAQYRIIREPTGQAKELTIWLSSDDPRWHTEILPTLLTEICLQEFEVKYGKLGLWVHKGMPILNSDLPNLRQKLGNLYLIHEKNLNVFWSKDILTMTPESLALQPPEKAVWFDTESAAFLHLFYKEFGPKKFNLFLAQCKTTDPEIALKAIYGFNSYAECDSAFRLYMINLSSDITGKTRTITPNSYLTWELPR